MNDVQILHAPHDMPYNKQLSQLINTLTYERIYK